MLAYAKKKKFIVRIRIRSVEPTGKKHPWIKKDQNQIQVPSGSSLYHLCSLLHTFSLSVSLFFAYSLFISFSCWSNSVTENEGNWELEFMWHKSSCLERDWKYFLVSGVWLLFSQSPRVSRQAPGRLCSALPISQDSVFLPCVSRLLYLKHTPCPACSNALKTNLKAASPQDAETSSLGPSVHLQKNEKNVSP